MKRPNKQQAIIIVMIAIILVITLAITFFFVTGEPEKNDIKQIIEETTHQEDVFVTNVDKGITPGWRIATYNIQENIPASVILFNDEIIIGPGTRFYYPQLVSKKVPNDIINELRERGMINGNEDDIYFPNQDVLSSAGDKLISSPIQRTTKLFSKDQSLQIYKVNYDQNSVLFTSISASTGETSATFYINDEDIPYQVIARHNVNTGSVLVSFYKYGVKLFETSTADYL